MLHYHTTRPLREKHPSHARAVFTAPPPAPTRSGRPRLAGTLTSLLIVSWSQVPPPAGPDRPTAATMAPITLKLQNRGGKSFADVQIGGEVRGPQGAWGRWGCPNRRRAAAACSRPGPCSAPRAPPSRPLPSVDRGRAQEEDPRPQAQALPRAPAPDAAAQGGRQERRGAQGQRHD